MSISNTRLRKPFLGFRPSGRHVPFKTRSRRFCQQSGPADANRRRGMRRVVLRIGSVRFDFLHVRNDFGTVFGVGRQYPMTNPSGTDLDREATRRGKYKEVFHHCE